MYFHLSLKTSALTYLLFKLALFLLINTNKSNVKLEVIILLSIYDLRDS